MWFTDLEICDECRGRGYVPVPCSRCLGSGEVWDIKKDKPKTCDKCYGIGEEDAACSNCHGECRVRKG